LVPISLKLGSYWKNLVLLPSSFTLTFSIPL
jgi:hypothetical protein